MSRPSSADRTAVTAPGNTPASLPMHVPALIRHPRRPSPWGRNSSLTPAINMLPVRQNDSVRASSRNLRRVVGRWLPIDNATLFARMTVLKHGGHTRPVIHRGSKHLRFRYTSVKMKCTQLGEGFGEQAIAMYNEVATSIAYYLTHPYEIELMVNGKIKRYRPDGVRQFIDGTIELYEVKRSRADLADPELRETLAQVEELARRSGWLFNVLFLDEILGTDERQTNVWSLFARRSFDLTREHRRIVGRLAGRGASATWIELSRLFSPADELYGDAVIECLLARGMLATDLDVAFRRDTILIPTRPFRGPSMIEL